MWLRHGANAVARPMEMPRSTSCGSKSVTALPSSTLVCLEVAPLAYRSALTSVVFPVSLCPATATLRMRWGLSTCITELSLCEVREV